MNQAISFRLAGAGTEQIQQLVISSAISGLRIEQQVPDQHVCGTQRGTQRSLSDVWQSNWYPPSSGADMNTTTTSIQVFTLKNLPGTEAIVAQASELAATHGLGIKVVTVEADAATAIAAGVMALPTIIAFSGSTEVARREYVSAGRRTRRWFERHVASTNAAPTLAPAMA
jgi:hypothetical protein